MSELRRLIDKVNNHYQKLLGFKPRRTSYNILNPGEWKEFCQRYDLDGDKEGVFLPRSLSAYLYSETEKLPLNLFHELFGHGLFHEYSAQGKFIHELEEKLMEEEREILKGKEFTNEELQRFRDKNSFSKLLRKKNKETNRINESFALWTEYYLSNQLGFEDRFRRRFERLSKEAKESLEGLIKFQEKHGELALFYEMEMPKYHNIDRDRKLLRDIFGERIEGEDLVLLYGSKEPYSDMDIFIVSDNIRNFDNGWLDIRAVGDKEFEHKLSMFDIAVTDPLLTGKLIFGDRDYLQSKRRQLQKQPITREVIHYNIFKAKEQLALSDKYPKGSEERDRGKSYSSSYTRNALKLRQGDRKLTKNRLM